MADPLHQTTVVCPRCGDATQHEIVLSEFTCGACDKPFSPSNQTTEQQRVWQEGWPNLADGPPSSRYAACMRRSIMAAINWAEQHPDAKPRWQTRDLRALARRAGVPDSTPIEQVAFMGAWADYIRPEDDDARSWFAAIVREASQGNAEEEPSFHMMRKALACRSYFALHGWDAFNRLMHETASEGRA